jgi:gas vesicle protein
MKERPLPESADKIQKKKRDPKKCRKPGTAYNITFCDTQAAIMKENPNASFGDVSKNVASMWKALREEQKKVYKEGAENAKKEYEKALAAYRASH